MMMMVVGVVVVLGLLMVLRHARGGGAPSGRAAARVQHPLEGFQHKVHGQVLLLNVKSWIKKMIEEEEEDED